MVWVLFETHHKTLSHMCERPLASQDTVHCCELNNLRIKHHTGTLFLKNATLCQRAGLARAHRWVLWVLYPPPRDRCTPLCERSSGDPRVVPVRQKSELPQTTAQVKQVKQERQVLN